MLSTQVAQNQAVQNVIKESTRESWFKSESVKLMNRSRQGHLPYVFLHTYPVYFKTMHRKKILKSYFDLLTSLISWNLFRYQNYLSKKKKKKKMLEN